MMLSIHPKQMPTLNLDADERFRDRLSAFLDTEIGRTDTNWVIREVRRARELGYATEQQIARFVLLRHTARTAGVPDLPSSDIKTASPEQQLEQFKGDLMSALQDRNG